MAKVYLNPQKNMIIFSELICQFFTYGLQPALYFVAYLNFDRAYFYLTFSLAVPVALDHVRHLQTFISSEQYNIIIVYLIVLAFLNKLMTNKK